MAKVFQIQRTGNDFFATADGAPRFFVGRRVPYRDNIGLYNIFAGSKITKLDFSAADFRAGHGFWADFIEPTALCEGRNFLTLNTYDSAAFTFGFAQFAAHVPDGDFVDYLRGLLALPMAADYFPGLALIDGRIHNIDGRAPVPLESATSTAALMAYLNPGLDEVQDREVLAAARLIHWTTNDPAARNLQVVGMIEAYRAFMRRADTRVGIDGRPAEQCCVIADILHQGRGGRLTWQLVNTALQSANPFEALIAIGAPEWNGRKATLKKAIRARPEFAQRRWRRASGRFE
jgi:hypothetical protein